MASDNPGTYTGYLAGQIPDLKSVAGTYDVQRKPGSGPDRPTVTGKGPTDGNLGFAQDVRPGELTPAEPVPGGIGESQQNPSVDPTRGRASREQQAGMGSARGANGASIDQGWRVGGENR